MTIRYCIWMQVKKYAETCILCVYVYIYIYIHVYIYYTVYWILHTVYCTRVSMYIYIYVWMDWWMDVWMHGCMDACNACIIMHVMHVCMYACVHVCANTNHSISIYAHTHTCSWVHLLNLSTSFVFLFGKCLQVKSPLLEDVITFRHLCCWFL